jgi:hypothetical protein
MRSTQGSVPPNPISLCAQEVHEVRTLPARLRREANKFLGGNRYIAGKLNFIKAYIRDNDLFLFILIL